MIDFKRKQKVVSIYGRTCRSYHGRGLMGYIGCENQIFIIEQLWDFSKFTTAELKCNECGLYFTDSLQTKNLDIHYFTNAFVIIEI